MNCERHTEHYEHTWRGIKMRISYAPHGNGDPENIFALSHLEVETDGQRCPLPITETGYRSVFTAVGTIEEAGGPIAYIDLWLEQAAQTKAWKRIEQDMRQGRLF